MFSDSIRRELRRRMKKFQNKAHASPSLKKIHYAPSYAKKTTQKDPETLLIVCASLSLSLSVCLYPPLSLSLPPTLSLLFSPLFSFLCRISCSVTFSVLVFVVGFPITVALAALLPPSLSHSLSPLLSPLHLRAFRSPNPPSLLVTPTRANSKQLAVKIYSSSKTSL